MNARERTLLFSLIAVVGVGVAIYGVKRWWWDPFQDCNRTIARLTVENDQEQLKWDRFMLNKKKLNAARLRSLSTKPDQAAADCMAYLQPLLAKSGLDIEDISKSSIAKAKVVTQIQGVKETGHQIVTFAVRVRGDLGQLVKALEKIQAAPFEHRIRSLTIDRVEPGLKKGVSNKLSAQIIIETILIARSANTGLPPVDPKDPLPQHAPNRYYADIARKNIFVGLIPYVPPKPPPPVDPNAEDDNRPKRPEEDTPRFIYLTQTLADQGTAYLRNRIYGFPRGEKKLVVGLRGYEEFQVTDENGEFLFFRAKLMKVEQRKIFFQIGKSNDPDFPSKTVFTVQIGQSLADARDYSANRSRIELEDDGLYDKEFAASEEAKDKKNAKDNKGKDTKKRKGKMGG